METLDRWVVMRDTWLTQVAPEDRDLTLVTILFQNATHKRHLEQFTVFDICTNSLSNRGCSVLIFLGMGVIVQ